MAIPLRPWLALENDSTTWPLAGQRHSTGPTGTAGFVAGLEAGFAAGAGLEAGFEAAGLLAGLLAGLEEVVAGLLATAGLEVLMPSEIRWPG